MVVEGPCQIHDHLVSIGIKGTILLNGYLAHIGSVVYDHVAPGMRLQRVPNVPFILRDIL